jgi:peptidylprolyl isomerase
MRLFYKLLPIVALVLAIASCSQQSRKGIISPPPDVSSPPPDAHGTPTGLFSRVLKKGSGTRRPGPHDTVTVHYTGWTTDGKMFDTSLNDGKPVTFRLDEVIPGWTEGVGQMVVGEKRRLWIPQKLAYDGQPGAPAGMLVFDVELLAIR